MARRTFEVIDVTEILMHWHAGRSQLQLAARLGVDPKTIRKYVAPALAAVLAPGGPALSEAQWAELVPGFLCVCQAAGSWVVESLPAVAREVTCPKSRR